MFRKLFLTPFLCASVFCLPGNAQDCAPPTIVTNAKSSNLFSAEQEMVLGELTVENLADEIRLVRDEKLLEYLNAVGGRLSKHLPPTGLKFQFHLIDLPEVNAFNIPGGHIFIARKLVAFVNNEDELAGIIAHELGHAVVRHAALDMSDVLRKVLGVKTLGDRKDIVEKYNLLIERARTKRLSQRRGHEDEQQLEADRIGLFAMVAAGYDPSAFTSAFARLTEAKGMGGGWFSDLFGNTPPEEKRLREMIRATQSLPAPCRQGRAAQATENFLKWQADLVSFRAVGRKEELPGLLWKKELAPKLRTDLSHFAFSADGKLFLAQDDSAVTVLERDPLRVLFQIPVEDANEASFTPDGGSVVFTTETLRYEKWNVAERKATEVRELVVRRDCWEHQLSPDGKYLACIDLSTAVNILDTQTGKKIWEKKEFYPLSFFENVEWLGTTEGEDEGRVNFFRIEFSPDSRFVMFSRSNRFRFRVRVDMLTIDETENTALALDLTTLKPLAIGGDLKKLAARPYLFLDAGRILGTSKTKTEDGGIFSFPSGKRLQKFPLGALEIKPTANPDYVVVKPLAEVKMGFFDLKKGIVASGLHKRDATLWNNLMVYEAVSGRILLRDFTYDEAKRMFDTKDAGTIEVPISSIKSLNAAQVSDNFDWLLLSSKTRGGLWNLKTGERKFHVRGFKGGIIADDGSGVGDFPKLDETAHSLVLMNANNEVIAPIRPLPETGARQYGRFVLLRNSLKRKEEKKDETKKTPGLLADDGDDLADLRREVRFELKDFIQDKVIWSRDYAKEAPEFSFDEFSGRLIFYWRLDNEASKAKLKESAELKAKAEALGNKKDDYLVEVVDAFAQKTIGMMLLETGKGSFDVGKGQSEGDWLVLRDSEGRVLVYSIANGELRHRFFGRNAAINPKRNQLAVENFPGEVALYDLDTGDRHANFVIQGNTAFVRFNLGGDKLFILSDAQSAYAFDLKTIGTKVGSGR